MLPIHAYILAGGKSSRFGAADQDKARALLHGQPLITRLASQLESTAASITIVADLEDKYADLNLTTIVDHQPGQGPLAGLERALTHHAENHDVTNHPYLLLLSCDLVEIRTSWINSLATAATNQNSSSPTPIAKAVCFADPATSLQNKPPRLHPMPGIYHQTLLPQVVAYLKTQQFSFQRLNRAVHHLALPLPADWLTIAQINTTVDWQNAQGQSRP